MGGDLCCLLVDKVVFVIVAAALRLLATLKFKFIQDQS